MTGRGGHCPNKPEREMRRNREIRQYLYHFQRGRKAKSEYCFFKRSIKRLNLSDFSYIKQVDGQIRLRETKLACMVNWNREIGSFQEDHARDCQEIEELRRICCEETHQARQARIEELSMQQQRTPATVSQTRAQIQDLQNKVNSLSFQENFSILNQGAALERPTFLIKPLRFLVPGPCHSAILDFREIHRKYGYYGKTFLNDHLFKKDYPLQSSTIQRIWHLPLST